MVHYSAFCFFLNSMASPSQEDQSLVARIAAGDREAADAFDARFRNRLVRFAQSRRIPVQDQNDLVQDVLLAAFQKFREHGFREESSLGTWLVGILNHKIADYWERHHRESARLALPENSLDIAMPSALDRVPDPTPHPDIALQMRQSLEALPKEHRVVLLLSVTEGWTTDEIAAILKMRPGTVGRVLWEAKQMLRAKLVILKKLGPSGD